MRQNPALSVLLHVPLALQLSAVQVSWSSQEKASPAQLKESPLQLSSAVQLFASLHWVPAAAGDHRVWLALAVQTLQVALDSRAPSLWQAPRMRHVPPRVGYWQVPSPTQVLSVQDRPSSQV